MRCKVKKSLLAIICTVSALAVAAGDLTAIRKSGNFALDGKLDEAFWSKAPAFSDYTNYRNGKSASCPTEIKFAYDNNALYVGIKAHMMPGSSYMLNDKNLYAGECVEIMLDPGATGNEYFHFMVNPNGAKTDEFRMQGGFVGDVKWEAFWEAKAYMTKEFWSCEMKIPFSSLDFPEADCKVWGVNATRTARNINKDGLAEDSAIAVDGAFHIAGKFRKLGGFDRDFTAYKGWQLTPPVITTAHAANAIAVSARLDVINGSNKARRAMVSVDLISPDKKDAQRQLRSTAFAPGKTEPIEFAGYKFKSAGSYSCVVTLRDGVTKRVLKKLPYTVPVKFQLMSIDLIDPHYKDAIFATMKLDKVRFRVNLAYPAKMLAGKFTTAGIRTADGKVLVSKKVKAAANTLFEFDAAQLPEGKLEIFSDFASADGKVETSNTHKLRKLAYKPGEVYLDKHANFVIDGKKQFIISQWAANEDFIDGVDAFLAWSSYKGTMYISPVLTHNRKVTKIRKNSAVSSADAEYVAGLIKGEMNKDKLFAYYLCDEPEVFGDTVSAISRLYEIITEVDPYHPVIVSNDSLGGIKDFAVSSDINGMHSYPSPSRVRKFANFSKIHEFCDMFNSVCKQNRHVSANMWLAQSFDYTNYAKVNSRMPHYIELRNEHLIAIISGATGLEIYNRFNTHYPELGIGLLEHIKEIKAYAPALAAERIDFKFNLPAGMRYTARKLNGKYWIFVANTQDKAMNNVKFTSPLLGNDKFKVMIEERSVKAVNGAFTDSFAPWAVHVYTNDPAAPALRSQKSIEAAIAQANQNRRKPGNLAFQYFEHETMNISASSNKSYNVRPDNCLWHLTDGIIEPPDYKHYYESQLVWTDKTPNQSPDWVAFEFKKPVTAGRVVIYPIGNSVKDFDLQLWVNNAWKTVGSMKNADGNRHEVTFAPVKTSKIRLMVNATRGKNVKITEIEVYGK